VLENAALMRRLFFISFHQKEYKTSMLSFFKYQGTGNDFVMIDAREVKVSLSQEEIAAICSRRFGVGADGLILLKNADGCDFRMVYYNADGREGSMCGNGGRCTVKFAADLGIFEKETSFIAVDGPHEALLIEDKVRLKMTDTATVAEVDGNSFYNTGSPHVVIYSDNLGALDVNKEGAAIRYNEYWQAAGGSNINFVELKGSQSIAVRTYERGVEAETYSCGTGVTACALDAWQKHQMKSPIAINTLGGQLEVSFEQNTDGSFSNIWLEGPALRVFKGIW
jgi:diaminopimelate epimerase